MRKYSARELLLKRRAQRRIYFAAPPNHRKTCKAFNEVFASVIQLHWIRRPTGDLILSQKIDYALADQTDNRGIRPNEVLWLPASIRHDSNRLCRHKSSRGQREIIRPRPFFA